MTEDEAREQLKLAMDLSEAAKRCAKESEQFAADALDINKRVEAFYQAQDRKDDASEDELRPSCLEVMERRDAPTFDRLAAAVAGGIDRVESGDLQRRPPITDSGVLVMRTPGPAEKPGMWTRIVDWWSERSLQRRSPVGW